MKWKSFFFKGVNFNNHYRVLGDKEKIISVCDFIITCQAIFKFKKKNSCWYKRYHLQGKKCVVAFKSEKYLLRLFITCKSILFSRLRLFNSKTCDDLADKKNLNPSICSRHSDEMNKLSMKVSLRKRELLPYITLVRDNQLACYR